MIDKLTIAILIPTFNRKEYIYKLLLQIQQQSLNNIYLIKIVIVDGSTDGTLEMLRHNFPDVNILKGDGNWWFTKSINEGFKYGLKLKPDFFLKLNDDVEIDSDYIQKLVSSYKKLNVPNAILGSISYSYSDKNKIIFAGVSSYNKYLGKYKHYFKTGSIVNPDTLYGIHKSVELPARGSLIPTQIVKALKGYDESFIQYGSDTDFCFSATEKGYPIYISFDAQIYCHEKLTSEGSQFRNPSFLVFLKSLFSSYSINSLNTKIIFTKKHYNYLEQLIIFPRLIIVPFIVFFWKKYKKSITSQ